MGEGVKCLVWDLDNTLWRGTALEAGSCRLRPGVRRVIEELDRRGVLQSVASRNEPEQVVPLLRRKHLERYFLHPQIGWGSKVRSLQAIAGRLGLALDALALVDDEPFEREQVRKLLPEVRTYPADRVGALPGLREFTPPALSDESRSRRLTYRRLAARDRAGRSSGMSQTEFLVWCRTTLRLRRAVPGDLPRIRELLRRTHQLNATGVVWPAEVLGRWLEDERRRVFVAELRDRFVDYGRIGVAVCRRRGPSWELVVFLLSCRVLGRGISGAMLGWVRRQARLDGAAELVARFRATGRNGGMERLFRLSGLTPRSPGHDGSVRFAGPALDRLEIPRWLTLLPGGTP